MRSILITAGVLAVLVIAFVTFLLTQKSTPPLVRRGGPPASLPAPTGVDGSSAFGAGEGGRLKSFNRKTGELTSEFFAAHFDPPVDNVVHVTRPEAWFYAHDGQVLKLSAVDGDITMAEQAKRPDRLGAIQSQPPSHGTLRDVRLSLHETADAEMPVLTCTVPVVAFDNDTLRLNTVPMTVDQKEVPGDQVPVTVRGRDYDFDGRGLTIRYNQRDRRLEFLEIAHGHRLVVKNVRAFGGLPTGEAQRSDRGPVRFEGRPVELAATDPDLAPRLTAEERDRRRERRNAATRRVAATQVIPVREPREIMAYRATFMDAVRINEADVEIGTADRMSATFTFDPDGQPATRPVAGATTLPTTRRARRPLPTQPAAASRPGATPAVVDAAPSTAPSGPIEIAWTGKLTVVPQTLAESGLRNTADRIVEFVGRPVRLDRQGSTIVAAYVWAALDGDRFVARPDDTTPRVTLRDAAGTKLTTESIEADGDNVIKLHGKSSAEIVLDAAQPDKVLTTNWTDLATIQLADASTGRPVIERALFRGHVDVRHPQIELVSDTLALGFTPGRNKAGPDLSSIRADGGVRGTVTGNDGVGQTISAATLDLATMPAAGGQIALRSLHAHGDVVASDTRQTLKTDDLKTTLSQAAGSDKPVESGLMAVEQLTATGHVQFTGADETSASGDQLSLDNVAGQQWVTLVGAPARVGSAESTLSGTTIRADTSGAFATIDGPGSLNGRQKQAGNKPAQPIEVTWSRSLAYDGPSNRATVDGDVVVFTRGNDNTISFAKGRSLQIAFADAAAARPTAATQASGLGAIGGAGKQVKAITLNGPAPANSDGNVEVTSQLFAAAAPSLPIRNTYLEAPALTINVNNDGTPGAIDVPSGGRVFYEDVAPSTQPATSRPAGAAQKIAVAWTRRMTYDPTKQQAIIDGDVQVVRSAPGADRMEMKAPRLVADVAGGSTPQGAQLKRVVANRATLEMSQVSIDAPTAIYEPAADRIIAKGTAVQPVTWYDTKQGLSRGSFGEIWWNLKTNQPEKLLNVTAEVNR